MPKLLTTKMIREDINTYSIQLKLSRGHSYVKDKSFLQSLVNK